MYTTAATYNLGLEVQWDHLGSHLSRIPRALFSSYFLPLFLPARAFTTDSGWIYSTHPLKLRTNNISTMRSLLNTIHPCLGLCVCERERDNLHIYCKTTHLAIYLSVYFSVSDTRLSFPQRQGLRASIKPHRRHI